MSARQETVRNYTFDHTAKTVTFTDYTSITIEQLFLITNLTTGTVIYQFNNSSLGGTAATNVLTLSYDTTSMSNTDKLQIIYEPSATDPHYDTPRPSGTTSNLYYNQVTSNSTAVQLSATSHNLINGLIIQALSTNTASVFVGDSSVTTGTGFELQPGQATSLAVSNQNIPYVIGSNNTDKICFIGN